VFDFIIFFLFVCCVCMDIYGRDGLYVEILGVAMESIELCVGWRIARTICSLICMMLWN
jgi:hypothetical protein